MKNKTNNLSKQYRKELSLPLDLFYSTTKKEIDTGGNEICASALIVLMESYDPKYWEKFLEKRLIKYVAAGVLDGKLKVDDDGFVYPNVEEQ